MIKLTYETEEGQVEAHFDTLDEMARFQGELRKRAEDRAKAEEAAREEKIREARERRAEALASREKVEKEVCADLRAAFTKAKEADISPKKVVAIIMDTLRDMADAGQDED